MIAYNHAEFIREAIEGILMQEVDFPVEFLIADDLSQDHTKEIVEQYVQNHPKGNLIRYVRHSQNKGMMGNFVWSLENCRGKYIALCEGDDYWIEPLKLKKQIDFLNAYLEYSLVSHYSKKIYFNYEGFKLIGKLDKADYSIKDSDYHFLPIPTASICFRKSFTIPSWFFKVYGGDRALIFLCSQHGKVKILDFVGSVYRVHENGIEQKYKKDKFSLPNRNIMELKTYYKLTNGSFRTKIIKKIAWNYLYISIQHLKNLKIFMAIYNSMKSIYWNYKYYFMKND